MKLSKKYVLDVVFGSDILAQGGGVVKETFEDEHYILKANNLTVTADVIIKAVEDIPDRMQPYLHIRNAPDRNRGLYPGTKVQASYFRRTAGLLIVDKNMNVVQMAKPKRQKAQPVPKAKAQVKPDQPQTKVPTQQPTPTQNKTAVQPIKPV